MGVFSIYNSQKNSKNSGAVAIRNPYLRAVGIQTDISHLIQYDEELAQKLNNEPADYIPLVCATGFQMPTIHTNNT